MLVPLLLLRARDELLEPGRQLPRFNAKQAEVASLTSEVDAQVQAVVDVLARRADAPGMFARWSTWLMRQQLRQRNQDPVDIRSSDYVDKALVVRLGRAVLDRGLVPAPPADAAPWEAWCYQCVLSMLADESIGEPPPFAAFADQWQLTPEDWHQQKGGICWRAPRPGCLATRSRTVRSSSRLSPRVQGRLRGGVAQALEQRALPA
ncbi:hypothetical protein WJ968_11195 [Achromobacter xylosoxidans]